VRRYIEVNSTSIAPDDYCEQCHDTGWYGDNGPGIKGNWEYNPCECDSTFRNKRRLARFARECRRNS